MVVSAPLPLLPLGLHELPCLTRHAALFEEVQNSSVQTHLLQPLTPAHISQRNQKETDRYADKKQVQHLSPQSFDFLVVEIHEMAAENDHWNANDQEDQPDTVQ